MKFVMFLVGLLVVFVLGFLISSDRKKIKYKPIAIMLIIQLALSYFLLNTQVGYILVKRNFRWIWRASWICRSWNRFRIWWPC